MCPLHLSLFCLPRPVTIEVAPLPCPTDLERADGNNSPRAIGVVRDSLGDDERIRRVAGWPQAKGSVAG